MLSDPTTSSRKRKVMLTDTHLSTLFFYRGKATLRAAVINSSAPEGNRSGGSDMKVDFWCCSPCNKEGAKQVRNSPNTKYTSTLSAASWTRGTARYQSQPLCLNPQNHSSVGFPTEQTPTPFLFLTSRRNEKQPGPGAAGTREIANSRVPRAAPAAANRGRHRLRGEGQRRRREGSWLHGKVTARLAGQGRGPAASAPRAGPRLGAYSAAQPNEPKASGRLPVSTNRRCTTHGSSRNLPSARSDPPPVPPRRLTPRLRRLQAQFRGRRRLAAADPRAGAAGSARHRRPPARLAAAAFGPAGLRTGPTGPVPPTAQLGAGRGCGWTATRALPTAAAGRDRRGRRRQLPAPAEPLTCCWIFPSSVTTQWVVAAAGRVPEASSEHRPRAQPEKTHARPSPPRPDAPAAAIFPYPGLPAPPGTGTAPAAILGGGGPSGRCLPLRGGGASREGRGRDRPWGGPDIPASIPGGAGSLPQMAPARPLRRPQGEGRPDRGGSRGGAGGSLLQPPRMDCSTHTQPCRGSRPELNADFKHQQAAGGAAQNAFIKKIK